MILVSCSWIFCVWCGQQTKTTGWGGRTLSLSKKQWLQCCFLHCVQFLVTEQNVSLFQSQIIVCIWFILIFLLGFSFSDLSPFLCFSCFLRPVVILLLELASTMAEFSYCCCSWDRSSVHLLMSDINLDSSQGTDKVSQDVMVGGWCHTCCGWPALSFKLLNILYCGLVFLFLRGSSQFFMVIVGFWFFGQLWDIQFLEYWEILSTYENTHMFSHYLDVRTWWQACMTCIHCLFTSLHLMKILSKKHHLTIECLILDCLFRIDFSLPPPSLEK